MPDSENINDELLSAYLDDELSIDERARVDARIAADLAARQMLEQLRAVSQAMQSLPAEAVGVDLRESILRRAEQAMLSADASRAVPAAIGRAAKENSANLPEPLPQFTIGRTKRGWMWAALAVAAGLMIIVFQPGGEQDEKQAQVAMSGDKDVDKDVTANNLYRFEGRPSREPSPSAPSLSPQDGAATRELAPRVTGNGSPARAAVAIDMAAPATSPATTLHWDDRGATGENDEPALIAQSGIDSKRSGGKGDELSASRAIASDPRGQLREERGLPSGDTGPPRAAAAPSGLSRRSYGLLPEDALPTSSPEDEVTPNIAPHESDVAKVAIAAVPPPAASAEENLLVVRVLVKRESLENKVFERLLAEQGIQIEDRPAAGGAIATERLEGEEKLDNGHKLVGSEDEPDAQVEEAVLVEAPEATIEACLTALNADEKNYLGMAIDNAATIKPWVGDKSTVATEGLAKERIIELGTRFNRGQVPSQQDLAMAGQDRAEPIDVDALDREQVAGGAATGGFGGRAASDASTRKPELPVDDSLGVKTSNDARLTRARRLRTWYFADGAQQQVVEETRRRGAVTADRPSLNESPRFESISDASSFSGGAGNLQVLFILTEGRPAPSPSPQER